jgi:hypothetical protein
MLDASRLVYLREPLGSCLDFKPVSVPTVIIHGTTDTIAPDLSAKSQRKCLQT